MKSKLNFLCLLSFIIPKIILGCSCESIKPFINNITKESSIYQVQIIQQGLLPVKEIKYFLSEQTRSHSADKKIGFPPPPLPPYQFESFTLLKIINVLQGNLTSDTLVFFNGYGSECVGSMKNLKIGTRYIIKVYEDLKVINSLKLTEYLGNQGLSIEDWVNKKVFSNGICYEWLLLSEDGIVKGNITENKKEKLLNEFVRNTDNLTEDEQEKKILEIRATKPEELEYEDFVNLINAISK